MYLVLIIYPKSTIIKKLGPFQRFTSDTSDTQLSFKNLRTKKKFHYYTSDISDKNQVKMRKTVYIVNLNMTGYGVKLTLRSNYLFIFPCVL